MFGLDLPVLWFILVAFLFAGYFLLEGFDFGVGILLPILGRDEARRNAMLRTIGPVWDGNEVWLITAGGALFAAFPEWYATMFSGFYLPLFLILLALIVRIVGLEWRKKIDDPTWRRRCDAAIIVGSWLPPVLWGVAVANLVRGVPLDADHGMSSGLDVLVGLLNPYALLGGAALTAVFILHGLTFLRLKTAGLLRDEAHGVLVPVAGAAVVLGAAFVLWTQIAHGKPRTWAVTVLALLGVLGGVAMVLRGAPSEDQISVLERVLSQAVAAVERYAAPDWVAEGRRLLGEGLLDHARAAEAGSDAQLAFVNALAMLPADGAGSLEVFRAILAGEPGSVGLDGLTVDEDMKWSALTVLVAAGDKGVSDIAAAEQADQSALGTQSAAKARAAIPAADNKIRVWNTCTATGAAAPSNLMLRSMIAGFTAPGSDGLLGDFTDRYFAEASSWWGRYSSETAQRMLEGLYPHWDVSREGLDKAAALLDDESTPAPVKRIVAENRHRVERALAARECDGFVPEQ